MMQMITLAYTESIRDVIAGRIRTNRALLQYDHSQWLRPLFPRFEVEQKIASQPAPSFETYCAIEAKKYQF
jgi:hypothetical protein